jgi:hypothetical protein
VERTQVTVRVPRVEAAGTARATVRRVEWQGMGRQVALQSPGTDVRVQNDGR